MVVNASAVGASATEVVLDSVVQEIDIPTGLVLFQWDSLDHVPLTASYTRPLNVRKKKRQVVKPNSVWTPYRLLPRQLGRGRRRREPPDLRA